MLNVSWQSIKKNRFLGGIRKFLILNRKVTSSADIRSSFIDFFQRNHNHEHIPSSKVFLADDQSINFVCAGMNQFKPVFLGKAGPDFTASRAVNSQRCIRAGGKHNDLDAVGYDYTHHTFFEMLGSWSFNNYFKEEACAMAWTLLTEVYCLPKDQLYITYFGGSDHLQLKPDLETKKIWMSLGVDENRILPFGTSDNFWDMGATGPCGPCTEIHFDRVPGRYNPAGVNVDGSDVVEIWNLVFMQFNRLASQRVEPLATLNVDTGMGLERVSAVLQGVKSNYDTDVFTPILKSIQELCKSQPYSGRLDCERDIAYRIISDHIRMLTVAIADGLIPGSTGSGLILRRVLRRAVLSGKNSLGAPDDFMKHLVPVVVDYLRPTYPGLDLLQAGIMQHISEAECVYNDMLRVNDLVVDQCLTKMKRSQLYFPFKLARKIYYHDGYPIERLQEKVEDHGKQLDVKGLEKLHYESENYLKNKAKDDLNKFAVSTTLSNHQIPDTQILNLDSSSTMSGDNIKVLCICNGQGEMMSSLNKADDGSSFYVVAEKSFSVFEDMNSFENFGNLLLADNKVVNIEKVIRVDDWILHKVSDTKVLNSSVLSLDLNKTLHASFLRAQQASHVLNKILTNNYKNQHALIKHKIRDDKLIYELSGVVSQDTLNSLIKTYKVERSPANINDVCCVRSKRSAKGRTVLTFVVGGRANTARKLSQNFGSEVDLFKEAILSGNDSVEVLKKKCGQIKNLVNAAEIPLSDKQVLLDNLQTAFKKLRNQV